ncbi:hypothetical protein [Planomonospora venezuelensis]|uniref:Secreted protein n=1 Tax=Planomonospora venezuelensis TaxID=1999 RepID=A0A841CSN2_PLAVE|nr:hypothetical protein [Planomonospora venezuelensis]MBB5960801.1 hypothetical protein [Planomonospora venezuelensis]GIN03805.1 hypothetical protein Pve01_54630 [Planomonospora venezuelensis]
MRIRILAAAVVTAGALMATLSGAASADTPTPPPPAEKGLTVVCEKGVDGPRFTSPALTEEEMKELEAGGGPAETVRVEAVPAVPARPGDASGTSEPGHLVVTGPDGTVTRLEGSPEGVKVTLKASDGPGEAGKPELVVEAVPAPEGAIAACGGKD